MAVPDASACDCVSGLPCRAVLFGPYGFPVTGSVAETFIIESCLEPEVGTGLDIVASSHFLVFVPDNLSGHDAGREIRYDACRCQNEYAAFEHAIFFFRPMWLLQFMSVIVQTVRPGCRSAVNYRHIYVLGCLCRSVEDQFIDRCRNYRNTESELSDYSEILVLYGYLQDVFRYIDPDFTDFLLYVHDAHNADVELESGFSSHDFYQCCPSPVLVGARVQSCVEVGAQFPERLDIEILVLFLCE